MRIHPIVGIIAFPLLASGVLYQQFQNQEFRQYHWSKLVSDLNDRDAGVRRNAVEAMAETKDPRAVEPLIAAMKDTDPGVRQSAAESLRQLDKTPVQPLIVALKGTDASAQQEAIDELCKLGEPAVQPLIEVLNDPDSSVEPRVVETLGRIGEPAVPPLIGVLRGRSEGSQWSAAMDALVRIGSSAVPLLIAELNSSNPNAKKGAIEALGSIGEPAVGPLIAALKQGGAEQCNDVTSALAIIGGPAVGPLKEVATGGPNKSQQCAIQALREIKDHTTQTGSPAARNQKHSDAGIQPREFNDSPTNGNPVRSSQTRDDQLAAHLAKAKALWHGGNPKGALEECNAALRLDPSNEEASALREQYTKALAILNGPNQ